MIVSSFEIRRHDHEREQYRLAITNLEDIQRAALGYFLAARVFIVEIDLGPAGAVQTFGKNSGDGGLAGAARAAEEVRMGDSLLLNGMGQRLCDMLLADDVAETLRTVFAGYDLIGHSSAKFGMRSAEFGMRQTLIISGPFHILHSTFKRPG